MRLRARGARSSQSRAVKAFLRCCGQARAFVGRRPTISGSVGEYRARLCEINCQSGKGLRVCAGQVAEPRSAHVARVMRSRSERLRRYGSGSILLSSFGGLPSVEPGVARKRADRCAKQRGQLR
jgi:hypothetical protein